MDQERIERSIMDDHIRLQTLDWDAYTRCVRRAAADGIVLLRNEKQVLPLPEGSKVALFGRGQLIYYKSGTGSGGMVNVSHVTGIREALEDDPGISLNQELMHLYDRWNDENPPRVGKGWGDDPWSQDEMPLSEDIVNGAAAQSDTAVCILARTAGEDRDNRPEEGSWYLTEEEKQMLRLVRESFDRMVVLLNVGNIIDMTYLEEVHPEAVLYVWQGGMIGGLGVADVLTGRVSPGGHLTDTIAMRLEDYPSTKNFGTGNVDIYEEDIYVGYRYFESVAKDRVLYPFGYGLTYTTFSIDSQKVVAREKEVGSRLSIDFDTVVTNTGHVPGRQVVQVYARCPQGELGKPARVLVDFRKTSLLGPGESETISFAIPVRRFASYDDSGATQDPGCWVLEPGRYDLYVGENVRDAVCITKDGGAFEISGNWPIEQAEEACAPVRSFKRMVMRSSETDSPDIASYIERPDAEDYAAARAIEMKRPENPKSDEDAKSAPKEYVDDLPLRIGYEDVPLRTIDNSKRVYEEQPNEFPYTVGDLKLSDVKRGECSLEEFIAQLTDTQLSLIVRGEGMGSSLVTPGTAAAFGGVSQKLRELDIPVLCCDDGPSGMRLDCGEYAFSLPNGTMLACTFDPDLNTELFSFLGLEMVKNRVDCLLGPGINIHRNPLNGRNFEYFSEDPYLTGVIASAQIKGLKEHGVTGVLKHFAANNRETNRHSLDSVVSERALREIYLRGFEIAVREGGADAIMTTYGLLNGVHTSSLYDLTTTILREEWGFYGIVMTDWWASFSPQSLIDETLDSALGLNEEADAGESGRIDEQALKWDLMAGYISDFSPMVRAQNDLYMVVPDGEDAGKSLEAHPDKAGKYLSSAQAKAFGIARDPLFRGTIADALRENRITRAELQRCAQNICRFALKSEAMLRLMGEGTSVEVINAPEGVNLDAVQNVEFVKVPGEGLTIDLSGLACERGDDSLLGFEMEPGVHYSMTFEGTCSAGVLAQVPMTLFFTSVPVASFIWNGTGEGTAVKCARFLTSTRNNVFRLHFGQTGVKLKSLTVVKEGPEKNGIILDVDGTLWDAVQVITDSWNEALRDVPDVKGTITADQMKACLGKTMHEIADAVFGYLPLERRREVLGAAMEYEVEYLREHPGNIYPNVLQTLRELRSAGWHLYIVSNCQKGYIEDYLHAQGEDGLIEDHICFEDTMQDKGSNIRLCVKRNELTKAVYVGDTAGDLAAARNAGIDFIYASYGFGDVDAGAEKVLQIETFQDLPEILRG